MKTLFAIALVLIAASFAKSSFGEDLISQNQTQQLSFPVKVTVWGVVDMASEDSVTEWTAEDQARAVSALKNQLKQYECHQPRSQEEIRFEKLQNSHSLAAVLTTYCSQAPAEDEGTDQAAF